MTQSLQTWVTALIGPLLDALSTKNTKMIDGVLFLLTAIFIVGLLKELQRKWLPLRTARFKANAFNSLDPLKAIKTMLMEDRKLLNKIREKADLLLNPDAAAKIQKA